MYFQLFQSSQDQQFYFYLKAGNERVLLQSIAFADKTICQKGIKSVRKAIQNPNCFTRKRASDGKFYFHLHALGEALIGHSQMYRTSRTMEKGIQTLVKLALQASVVYLPSAK